MRAAPLTWDLASFARMLLPSFGSSWLVAANVASICVLLAIVGTWLWSWRHGRRPALRDLLILVSFSVGGVYLPVFPGIWLAKEVDDNRMVDGTVRFPFVSGQPPARSAHVARTAALAHLGVPLLGPLLPLAITRRASADELVRAHSRSALRFQCGLFVVWTAIVAVVTLGGASPTTLPVVLGAGFLMQLPQIFRALAGQPPLSLSRSARSAP